MAASQGFTVCRHIRFFGQAAANGSIAASALMRRPQASRLEHRPAGLAQAVLPMIEYL